MDGPDLYADTGGPSPLPELAPLRGDGWCCLLGTLRLSGAPLPTVIASGERGAAPHQANALPLA